ncbi:MAG: hypothetical protein ACE5LV_05540 [Candidatus Aminicenantales bacterium]
MSKASRRIGILVLFLPFLLSMAPEETHAASPTEFIGKAANFLVLFGALGFLLWKPLQRFLKSRTQALIEERENTRRLRQEAETRLQEASSRLAEISREIDSIRREGEAQGQALKERILREARAEATRLESLSRQEIEMMTHAGIAEIKRYTAERATALARKRIASRMSPEDQSRLISRAIQKLGEFHERTDSRKEVRSGTR